MPPPPSAPGLRARGDLVAELVRLMWRHPWLTLGTVGPSVLMPAIEPAQAWFLKVFIDRLQEGGESVSRDLLMSWVPAVAGVYALLLGLKYVEKMFNRIFDERLLIDMQRAWFDRRGACGSDETVARMMNDSDKARKILDLLQRDLWGFAVGIVSVVFWQMQISREWVPALLAALTPILVATILVTWRVAVLTRGWLRDTVAVVERARAGDRDGLHAAQESVYRGKIRCEWWKQGSEAVAETAAWGGIAILLGLAAVLAVPVMPARIAAGDLAMFWVNLGLIGRQVQELAKFANKAAEAWPAVERVMRPDWEKPDDAA